MKTKLTYACAISAFLIYASCTQTKTGESSDETTKTDSIKYGGFESQVKWGEHIVLLGGCGDCHTPKKMTDKGPVDDESLLLSGHPSQMPPPPVDRKEMESKGVGATQTLTAWVGPWGISYTANLTPDSTGIGSWTEAQFIKCLREGKFKGLDGERMLLPPMPWQTIAKYSDDELKALFAYLKSIKPIHNIVPAAAPPVTAMK